MHPITIMPTKQLSQSSKPVGKNSAPFGIKVQRLLLSALAVALALAISGPAAADKRHDHRHGHSHGQQHSKHHGHPVHHQHPRYTRGMHHHHKQYDKHYSKQHYTPPRHHAPAQGFSLNIWGISSLLSGHNHHVNTSFHYHGQERCYRHH